MKTNKNKNISRQKNIERTSFKSLLANLNRRICTHISINQIPLLKNPNKEPKKKKNPQPVADFNSDEEDLIKAINHG